MLLSVDISVANGTLSLNLKDISVCVTVVTFPSRVSISPKVFPIQVVVLWVREVSAEYLLDPTRHTSFASPLPTIVELPRYNLYLEQDINVADSGVMSA